MREEVRTNNANINEMISAMNQINNAVDMMEEYCENALGVKPHYYNIKEYLKIIQDLQEHYYPDNCIKCVIEQINKFAQSNDIYIINIDIGYADISVYYINLYINIDSVISNIEVDDIDLKLDYVDGKVLFIESSLYTNSKRYICNTLEELKEVIGKISKGD